MLTVSDQFLAALRYPHLLAKPRATLTPADGSPSFDLNVTDGSVTIDRTADSRRTLELHVAPRIPGTSTELYPSAPNSPLNVYGAEITVYRGIQFEGSAETVQLGVFRVESLDRQLPGGEITITGWDRSRQVYDERFLKPHRFDKMGAIALIKQLILDVYPDATFEVNVSDSTQIRKHHVDRDRWAEITRVAQIIGSEVFATETGNWRIQDIPDPSTAQPVWTIDAGPDGVLVGATDTTTREYALNAVIALGETFSGDTGIVTISNASPGVITQTDHGLVFGQELTFSTGGTLPNPLTAGDTYFVHSIIDKDHFTVSPTYGGAVVNTTTNGSGTHRMSVTGYPVYGIAEDTNPRSPTNWDGPFGHVPKFFSSPHITTQAQADKVARKQLADHLGISRTISFQSVPNPALEAGDMILIKRSDGTSETHIIDALTIPLGAAGVMEGETRVVDWQNAE